MIKIDQRSTSSKKKKLNKNRIEVVPEIRLLAFKFRNLSRENTAFLFIKLPRGLFLLTSKFIAILFQYSQLTLPRLEIYP
jgi:hypothetical protein